MKPFTVRIAPTRARASENANIGRDVDRMATDAVTMAICKKTSAKSKYGSRFRWRSRSRSSFFASASMSSGFGSSSSGTWRRRALADFLAHRVLAGLEGVQEALGLLLEELPALVEPLAGAPLRLGRELLRLLRHVTAPLGEELTRLL